jgi:hypothetical protein
MVGRGPVLLTALTCVFARLAAAQDAPPVPFPPPAPLAPGFSASPPAPPAACQELIASRDDYQKNGAAIQAKKGKADPPEACKLFKTFLASETKMLQGLEQHQQECGVPTDIIKHLRDEKTNVTKLTGQICEVAANPQRPSGPSLNDELNSTPTLPKPGRAWPPSDSWPPGDYPIRGRF